MENVIVIGIIAAAAGYAAWRISRVLRGKADPCEGCQLKAHCHKNKAQCRQ